ncbi:hypothetical protein [Burkholderia ubonensis]|uniref:hypothetical protein n=1 Tax=Burkholderia ubonensis TaxID=101571 RepID=UPI000AD2F7E7|nr:hypothetical protein [Burkholderia ubonensis]
MSTILFIDFAQSARIAANRHGATRAKSMQDKPESPIAAILARIDARHFVDKIGARQKRHHVARGSNA